MPASSTLPTFAVPLLNRLEQVKGRGNTFTARCPAHDDRTPSLSVTVNNDRVLLHCHTGCEPEAIVQAMGMEMSDLFADSVRDRQRDVMPIPFPAKKPRGNERLVAVYQYTDLSGNVMAEKSRWELSDVGTDGKPRKTFRWRRAGQAGWSGGVELSELALWGAETVMAAPPEVMVYYVEGEKAAEACRAAGLLAVTHAGGAATKDFGASLEVLRGRKVALWPDNDATGREYMATVHARLRDVAASVNIVSMPLPPKGDAVEYFAAGGTVAALEAGALALAGPSVEYLAADNIRIRVPSALGGVTFNFEEMEKRARSLETELTITLDGPGVDRTPYSERINLLSASARTELRRDLDTVYGKEHGWPKLLNSTFSLARERFLTYDRSVDAYDIIPLSETELFFHDPLVPRNAVTILFGDRGSGKSYIAEGLCFCAALGEPFLGQRLPQGPVLFVDYEDNDGNFRRRLDRLAAGYGLPMLPGVVHYMNLMGMPIADAVRAIRKKVISEGIVLVIIDSLGPATGGDPSATDAAITVMQTLRSIGCTVVCLAHVPKNHGEQPKDPFGSVFYSNLSRRTWYVERVQEEASDVIDVGLYCKKLNDGPMPPPIAVQITFDGKSGPVRLAVQRMANVSELQEKRPVKWRVWDALDHGQTRTIPDLMQELAPAGATDADRRGLQKQIENALADSKRFIVVGEWSPPGRGRPLNLWGRVALPDFS